MNLIFSYSVTEDKLLLENGHIFIGAGYDQGNSEVHIFLKKDECFPEQDIDAIRDMANVGLAV